MAEPKELDASKNDVIERSWVDCDTLKHYLCILKSRKSEVKPCSHLNLQWILLLRCIPRIPDHVMTGLKVHRLSYDRSCLHSVWRWHINDLFSPMHVPSQRNSIFLASKCAQVTRDVMIGRTRSLFIAFQFKIIKLQGSTGLGRGSLRKRLNNNYIAVSKQSITTLLPSEPNTDVRQPPKKSAAAIAEVADRLPACNSYQSIMTAVLSTFAA